MMYVFGVFGVGWTVLWIGVCFWCGLGVFLVGFTLDILKEMRRYFTSKTTFKSSKQIFEACGMRNEKKSSKHRFKAWCSLCLSHILLMLFMFCKPPITHHVMYNCLHDNWKAVGNYCHGFRVGSETPRARKHQTQVPSIPSRCSGVLWRLKRVCDNEKKANGSPAIQWWRRLRRVRRVQRWKQWRRWSNEDKFCKLLVRSSLFLLRIQRFGRHISKAFWDMTPPPPAPRPITLKLPAIK